MSLVEEVVPLAEEDIKLAEELKEEVKKQEEIPAKIKTWIRYLEEEFRVGEHCVETCDAGCALDVAAAATTWRDFALQDSLKALREGRISKDDYFTIKWVAIGLREKLLEDLAKKFQKKCVIKK